MKLVSGALMLLFAILFAPLNAANTSTLPGFEASYEVEHKGMRVGETRLTLRATENSDEYIYESSTRAKGLASLLRRRPVVESTRFRFRDGAFVPLAYEFQDGTGKGSHNARIEFDWDRLTATATYKGETRSMDLVTGMLDRLLLQLVMMRDFTNGTTHAEYRLLDRHAARTYRVERAAVETLTTPAGEFAGTPLTSSREGSSRTNVFWRVPELGLVPARMAQRKDGEITTVLTLTGRTEPALAAADAN